LFLLFVVTVVFLLWLKSEVEILLDPPIGIPSRLFFDSSEKKEKNFTIFAMPSFCYKLSAYKAANLSSILKRCKCLIKSLKLRTIYKVELPKQAKVTQNYPFSSRKNKIPYRSPVTQSECTLSENEIYFHFYFDF